MPTDNVPHWSPNQYNPVQEYTYKFTANGELRIRLFYPYDWTPRDRRPAILFFFGGGWNTGSYVQFFRHAMYFAGCGMVAASAEYRIKSKHASTIETSIADAFSAVAWMTDHAADLGIDATRLVTSGGSAGGHLAACTALLDPAGIAEAPCPPAKPAALVLFNPAVQLRPGLCERFAVTDEDLHRLSPMGSISSACPPTFMCYGKNDPMIETGRAFAAKARALGITIDLHEHDGAAHGFFNSDPWFKETLKQAHFFLAAQGFVAQV